MNLKQKAVFNNIISFFSVRKHIFYPTLSGYSNSVFIHQKYYPINTEQFITSFTILENNSTDNNKNLSDSESHFQVNSEIHKLSLQEISSLSLNRHAIEILIFILKNDPTELLMKDIAIGLNLNKNHLSKIIFDLLAKGLIVKKQNIFDVRSNYIQITEKGIDVLYSIWFDLEHYFSSSNAQ